MRDLMFASFMVLALPLAFMRPLNAYLLWGWTGMLIPTSYFYGFMADARLNFFFALITLSLIVLGKVKITNYQNNRVTWFYLLFIAHCTLSFAFGYSDNPLNAQYFEVVVKLMIFVLVMPLFVRERQHFHAVFIIIALGLGLHGVMDGLKTIASAGGHNMAGVPGSMMNDRNHLSTALVLSLPVSYYLALYSRARVVRFGFWMLLITTAIAVLGGGSRGGFLAISVLGIWFIVTSRHKVLAISLGLSAVLAFSMLAPERWTDRISTVQEAQSDKSFIGRVIAWRVSTAIALENPVFGGGFHAVQTYPVWETFKASPGLLGFLDLPVPEFAPKAAHSIYFELLGDLGFVGLSIFLTFISYALWNRWKICRQIGTSNPQLLWARDMADMLFLAIISFLVGGSAVSLAYFEVIYMFVMLMELLRIHVEQSIPKRQQPKARND
ncbi:MAG: putative O-glycosylation ligase, exosortase A system-associated [Hydrogenophaga sp.]|uniref:putative O-glycosylation ligase, exosortase A system-associated n=1 Tax=Hydrogenophaga sp. TaxID=1904254 RepID=UPI002735CF08|nr:putative O-glycosylation ligase, exosortase A system-associated [Hydrogenophaga sp.]MDP3626855.1 putative O-glycosylation ligase, exosortase A system-associated [Hydrogenophaga sp.]